MSNRYLVRGQPKRPAFCRSRDFSNLGSGKGTNRAGRVDATCWRTVTLERPAIGVCPQLSGREHSCNLDGRVEAHTNCYELGRDSQALSAAGQSTVEFDTLSRVERGI